MLFALCPQNVFQNQNGLRIIKAICKPALLFTIITAQSFFTLLSHQVSYEWLSNTPFGTVTNKTDLGLQNSMASPDFRTENKTYLNQADANRFLQPASKCSIISARTCA